MRTISNDTHNNPIMNLKDAVKETVTFGTVTVSVSGSMNIT